VSPVALLIADAGPASGLGHLSRLSAIAVALRCRGFETRCHAYEATGAFELDGVPWAPWVEGDTPPSGVDVVLLDSYRLRPETAVGGRLPPVVVMHDHGRVPTGAALVVSAGATPSEDPRWLAGFSYAALRPTYWGLPARQADDSLRRILVTTGGGDLSGVGLELAQAVARELPEAGVAFVRGPQTPSGSAGEGVDVVEAPNSLAPHQLAADLVICGAGQTMLETAACGTPCLALVLAENQRDQALRLASLGATRLVDPARVDAVLATVRELATDLAPRRELSRDAQRAVDGYGALRIAYQVEAFLRRSPTGGDGPGRRPQSPAALT
jgi:spore coat polysaccharide biosynthesis predicted glycosyltransferase SpsG